MKFQDVEVGQHFRVTDPLAPEYARDTTFECVSAYPNTERRIYVNAQRIQMINDAYDSQWINSRYLVELT